MKNTLKQNSVIELVQTIYDIHSISFPAQKKTLLILLLKQLHNLFLGAIDFLNFFPLFTLKLITLLQEITIYHIPQLVYV